MAEIKLSGTGILVIGAAVGVTLVYIFRKQLGITAVIDAVAGAVKNAATGQLSDSQIASLGQQAYDSVRVAGGSAADAEAARRQVVRQAVLSQPLVLGSIAGVTIKALNASDIVPGTGQTVISLREAGYSDSDIVSMYDVGVQVEQEQMGTTPPIDVLTAGG